MIPRSCANLRPGEDLADDLDRLADREPARDQVLERGALDVLHRDPVAAVGLAAVVDADDVRVLEAGRGLRLAPEALDELGVLGEALVQELERHAAAEHRVVGEPDVGHPAAAEPADQRVAVADPLSRASSAISPLEQRSPSPGSRSGPATSPPKQPVQRSTVTATAICGSSAGAKPMNQGWLMLARRRSPRCRSCRRTSTPSTRQAGRGPLLGDVGHHLGELGGGLLARSPRLLVAGVELLDRRARRGRSPPAGRSASSACRRWRPSPRPRPSAVGVASTWPSAPPWPIATRPTSKSVRRPARRPRRRRRSALICVVGIVELGIGVEAEPLHVLDHRVGAELLADLGPVGVDRVGQRGRSCRCRRSSRRRRSASGDAADLLRRVGVEHRVGLELARVERRGGGHHLHRRARRVARSGSARLTSGARLVLVELLELAVGSRPRSGRSRGPRPSPAPRPWRARSRPRAPPAPLGPAVDGDRRLERLGGDPLRLGVDRQREVGALGLLVAELVDDRGELVLLAGQQVVLRQLDPAAADVDEVVADRVAEQRPLRVVGARRPGCLPPPSGMALGDQHAVGGRDRAARDLLLLDQRPAVLGRCPRARRRRTPPTSR